MDFDETLHKGRIPYKYVHEDKNAPHWLSGNYFNLKIFSNLFLYKQLLTYIWILMKLHHEKMWMKNFSFSLGLERDIIWYRNFHLERQLGDAEQGGGVSSVSIAHSIFRIYNTTTKGQDGYNSTKFDGNQNLNRNQLSFCIWPI